MATLLNQLFAQGRDQTKELHKQSNALGWIVAQLQHGASVHQELREANQEFKQDLTVIKGRLTAVEASPDKSRHPSRFSVSVDSLTGLLNAGRPYLIACMLVLGKLFGLGPSWIEPLAAKIIAAM